MIFFMQKSFVLHSRPFRETSLIIELLTRDLGRVSVLARGAKRSKKQRNLLHPFVCLDVDFKGKNELQILTQVESNYPPLFLKGKSLACGFYLNELLMRILHKHDPHPEIFDGYQQAIFALRDNVQIALRQFEKQLLHELGYAINFEREAVSHTPIVAEKYYRFLPEDGFVLREEDSTMCCPYDILGEHLLLLARDDYCSLDVLKTAKIIMRMALRPLIGEKPLKSREILIVP